MDSSSRFIKFRDLSRPMARMGGGVGQGGFGRNLKLLPFSQSEMNLSDLGVVSQCQEKFSWESSELRRFKPLQKRKRCRRKKKKTQPQMTQDQMTQHRITQHKTVGISQGWSSICGGLARNASLRNKPELEMLCGLDGRVACRNSMKLVVLPLPNWARRAVSLLHASLATSKEMLHPEALPLKQLAVKRVATSSHVPLDIHTSRPQRW